jgi:hypothetical protein
VRIVFTCLAWLAATGVGLAQATPYLATVALDNVSLRSGPGRSMEETGSLARGELVIVLHEVGEQWVAVEPPRGQVSWIRTVALKEIDGGDPKTVPRNAVVQADPDVEIAMGRHGLASPLTVRKERVPDGTIVKIIGTNSFESNGPGRTGWTPIQPVKGECRYLPRGAVQFVKGQATETYTVRSPAPSAITPPAAESTPAAGAARAPTLAVPAGGGGTAGRGKPADWPQHTLWLQAEQASDRQDYQRAERLYLQLASDMNQPDGDVDLANLCYERVHAVYEKQRAAGRPAAREAGGATTGSVRGDRDGTDRSATAKSDATGWTGAGTIRPTGFQREGEPRYSFRATGKGGTSRVVAYLEAGPGVDLSQWREGETKLFGTRRYTSEYGDVPVLTVARVQRADP